LSGAEPVRRSQPATSPAAGELAFAWRGFAKGRARVRHLAGRPDRVCVGRRRTVRFRDARPRPAGYERRESAGSPILGGAFSLGLRRGIAIGAKLARTTVAVLSTVAISFAPLAERPVRTRPAIRKAIALPIRPIGKPATIALRRAIGFERLSLDIRLRRIRSGGRLPLKGIRLLLVSSTGAFRWRSKAIGHGTEIIVFVEFAALAFAGRALLTALRQRLSSLSRSNQSKIMLGVLQVVLCSDWVASSMCVARKLKIFLSDMLRVPSNFNVRTI
jgi:hypothetical protein